MGLHAYLNMHVNVYVHTLIHVYVYIFRCTYISMVHHLSVAADMDPKQQNSSDKYPKRGTPRHLEIQGSGGDLLPNLLSVAVLEAPACPPEGKPPRASFTGPEGPCALIYGLRN